MKLYKRQPSELVFSLYAPNIFPLEVREKIIRYLSERNCTKVSLVSSTFYELTCERIWNEPKLKKRVSAKDLEGLNHLPIKVLRSCWLDMSGYDEFNLTFTNVFSRMPHLERILLTGTSKCKLKPENVPLLKHMTKVAVEANLSYVFFRRDNYWDNPDLVPWWHLSGVATLIRI